MFGYLSSQVDETTSQDCVIALHTRTCRARIALVLAQLVGANLVDAIETIASVEGARIAIVAGRVLIIHTDATCVTAKDKAIAP